MPAFLLAIALKLGISPMRLITYGVIAFIALGGALTIRQHYINLGWKKAISAVKKQDDKSKAAAEAVDRKADECAANSFWDVISQGCKEDK